MDMNNANSTPAMPKKRGLLSRAVGAVKSQIEKNNNTPQAKAYRKQRALKEIKDIERGFGSLENYEQFYPQSGAQIQKLRADGGYSSSSPVTRFPRR